MKKLILILLCLPMIFSCRDEKNKIENDLSKENIIGNPKEIKEYRYSAKELFGEAQKEKLLHENIVRFNSEGNITEFIRNNSQSYKTYYNEITKQKEKLKRAKEAEKKQLAEEKKKQLAEKRRLEEQEQKRKEISLKLQLKAEELSLKQSLLKRDYMIAIKEQVERNWRRPQESSKIESCEVRVLQGPGGIIMDVTFGDCDGGTSAYRRSIENAVYKAEPLPQPGDKTLFEREINFIFSPK